MHNPNGEIKTKIYAFHLYQMMLLKKFNAELKTPDQLYFSVQLIFLSFMKKVFKKD